MKYSLDQQIAEINRELQMRLKVYPQQIKFGKITKKDANIQYGKLMAAKKSLMRLMEMEHGKQLNLLPDQGSIKS